jgi:hypothetical protein
MPNHLIPQTINNRGVITATDDDGLTHHFHTQPDEAHEFFRSVQALAAGREELGLLLTYQGSPTHSARCQHDGRSDEELKSAWLRKVTDAGLSKEAALKFLAERLKV